MPQVKKKETRKAILDAAYTLFREHGYYQTTLRQIASRAHTSLANVYVYFDSKYQIVFELYDPWMVAKIEQLERDAISITDPRERLRHVLLTLWHEIPMANNRFARNVMQALSIANSPKDYNPKMVRWIEGKITKLLLSCVPANRRRLVVNGALAHVFVMAFDGFVINQGLNPSATCNDDVVDAICSSLLGDSTRSTVRGRSKSLRFVSSNSSSG